nr:reverse transcriptase domain-containing protein [Tanacetum cinerariifolium]
MMCNKMVLEEDDRVERFIESLPDNIQESVMATEPTRLQDVVHIAKNMMDKKLKGYACTVKCSNYKKVRHKTRDCRSSIAATNQGTPRLNQMVNTCFECGAPGQYRKDCPKIKNQNHRNKARIPETRGKAYVLGGGDANPGFDTITRLLGHPFNIDLMPIDLGTFNVIIGIDWLAKNHAVIICDKKIVRIPYRNEILIVQGDKSDEKKSMLSIISCVKAHKYMEKGCQLFLAQVTVKENKDKSKEKRLEDVPTIRDFSEVFP